MAVSLPSWSLNCYWEGALMGGWLYMGCPGSWGCGNGQCAVENGQRRLPGEADP